MRCFASQHASIRLINGAPSPASLHLTTYSTDFIITTSIDGHLKLWKKQDTGIEFVKHYRAHMMPIVGVSASADGELFASIAEDESAKVFDVVNFGASGEPSLVSVYVLTSPFRYDQHGRAWIRAKSLLLGASERPSPGRLCRVCPLFILLATLAPCS